MSVHCVFWPVTVNRVKGISNTKDARSLMACRMSCFIKPGFECVKFFKNISIGKRNERLNVTRILTNVYFLTLNHKVLNTSQADPS